MLIVTVSYKRSDNRVLLWARFGRRHSFPSQRTIAMSHLKYYDYEGFGERTLNEAHITQAVRVGDIIEVAGQGIRRLSL